MVPLHSSHPCPNLGKSWQIYTNHMTRLEKSFVLNPDNIIRMILFLKYGKFVDGNLCCNQKNTNNQLVGCMVEHKFARPKCRT